MTLKEKKTRNQKDTRAKLLKAALTIFSRDGYDAATTRGIAKKAGVNESLIHRYFKSKKGLFFALKKQFRDNLVNEILSYSASENLEEELIQFIQARLRFTTQDKKFFKLTVSRAILDPKLREDVQAYAQLRPLALIERFENFRRKGKIRSDVDLNDLIGILHSLSFAFSIFMDAIECLNEEEIEKLLKTGTKLIARGLAPDHK